MCVCELPDFGWSVQGNSSQAPQLLVTPVPLAVDRDRDERGWLEGFAVKDQLVTMTPRGLVLRKRALLIYLPFLHFSS